MNKIALGFYDLFAFTIPGLIMIICFIIMIDKNIIVVSDLKMYSENTSITLGLMFLLLGYLLGSALYVFSDFYYKKLGLKIWKVEQPNISDVEYAAQVAWIRKFAGSDNYRIILRWITLKVMAQNLSLIFWVLGSVCIVKFINASSTQYGWIILGISSMFLAIIFLYRAIMYHRERECDIKAIIKALEQGASSIEQENRILTQSNNSQEPIIDSQASTGLSKLALD